MEGMVPSVLYPLALHARRALNWYTLNATRDVCKAWYRIGGRWGIVVIPGLFMVIPGFDGAWQRGGTVQDRRAKRLYRFVVRVLPGEGGE
ncbi:MAG: hypothetical protein A4E62_00123 [Syntrophorhabdus sp. PtaU1.Bin002]|nr:MAG: hypothetical protein A4E58_00286 [Syntrophorhabdus sp. PtaB.Bin006]OPY73976.1 MAG: hypothetical protein A4E62_00123 [Syntrophorhabdus sp. PtaU1.Bin002]